jgi:superfamily II DNA/RNA helicase
VHGDLNQEQRERAMAAFKAGKKDILIATDVAARGIDVNDVTHVINHTVPDDPDTYLHRAGRTGRAGKTGIAVTFVDWDDLHKWGLIHRGLQFGPQEPVETYSSSPHLYSDLDIPQGVKGRLKPSSIVHEPRARTAGSTGERPSGERGGSGSGGSDSRPPRQRTRGGSGSSGASGSSHTEGKPAHREPGGGAHDGTAPTRRRRTRRRTGGSSGGAATPPAA